MNVVLYACEILTLYKRDRDTLLAFEMKCYRRILLIDQVAAKSNECGSQDKSFKQGKYRRNHIGKETERGCSNTYSHQDGTGAGPSEEDSQKLKEHKRAGANGMIDGWMRSQVQEQLILQCYTKHKIS
jgi:hypothetical protein